MKLNRRQFIKSSFAVSAAAVTTSFFVTSTPAFAAKPSINIQNGFALKGYDTVAYFKQNEAVDGNSSYQVEYMGASFRFSSAENRDLFTANPEAYAPQYGGYCAFAVSKGGTANGDPEAWTVYNGKLYLNVNKTVRGFWLKDKDGNIAKANANWPKVLG